MRAANERRSDPQTTRANSLDIGGSREPYCTWPMTPVAHGDTSQQIVLGFLDEGIDVSAWWVDEDA